MPKDIEAPPPSAPQPAPPPILLEEFCRRASAEHGSTELLAAFHFDETRQGRLVGTTAEFNARLAQYRARPVE